jgi:hypothetical protein
MSSIHISQTVRRRGKSLLKDVPSMAEFVHKRTVLRQYRHFLKTVGKIPTVQDQVAAQEEIRLRFRQLQTETDTLTIQMALKEGERRLQQVSSLVGYAPAAADKDSWINTQDPEDPRGRVGTLWPWQDSK